jgi:erythromycin esterase
MTLVVLAIVSGACKRFVPSNNAAMQKTDQSHATLDEWIEHEAIPFAVDSSEKCNAAIDRVVASLGGSVELLGFGEALHGGEEILILRNRLFQRLVEARGYTAIVIESSFPKALLVNNYIAGRGPGSYEEVKESGFGHGFGRLEANRELVEWMRRYNADPSHPTKLQFYGFDIPTGTMGIASPRQVLEFVLDYLLDGAGGQERRQRIHSLLGEDAQWENPAAYMEPAKSIGLSPGAAELRIETEDLLTELRTRRPELVARSSEERYLEALHHAVVARQLLNFHAELARRKPGQSPASVLGVRDALMADTLEYIVAREHRRRGRVLVFAHNAHLQRGKAVWPGQKYWGTDDPCEWWPAGSHLDQLFGPHYAVIATAVGVSDENGIGRPEPGTLEARLTALPGPAVFIPTHQWRGRTTPELDALPTRSGSMKNQTYAPLTRQSFNDFDSLAVLDSTVYYRGGMPLQEWKPPKDQTR